VGTNASAGMRAVGKTLKDFRTADRMACPTIH
jgi:hypothetical protein